MISDKDRPVGKQPVHQNGPQSSRPSEGGEVNSWDNPNLRPQYIERSEDQGRLERR